MSQIYSNCTLTIAALWGNDSHSGCFIERNPVESQDCRIADWQDEAVYVKSTNPRGASLEIVEPKPLLDRAWVLQERLLSPWTLYYGPRELHWECDELEGNETNPKGVIAFAEKETLKSRFRNLEPIPRPVSANDYREVEFSSMYRVWTDIRNIYWSSRLSRHSDSLVAISGITKVMGAVTGMNIVSGLWTSMLRTELLWSVSNPSETTRTSLCQTWSWASLKGAKVTSKHGLIPMKTCAYHVSFEAATSTLDRIGSIQTRGALIPITLQRNTHGVFLGQSNRFPEVSYHLDVTPRSGTCEVVCLVVVEWEADRNCESYNPVEDLPGNIRLILAPVAGMSSTFERTGIWTHKYYRSEERIVIKDADIVNFHLI